jgi:maleylacetate reductase
MVPRQGEKLLSLPANKPIGRLDRTPNPTAPRAAFTYEALPSRVVFGEGTMAGTADEADRLGIKRALVLTTSQQHADGSRLGRVIGHRLAAEFPEAAMHTPVAVTERAMGVIEARDIDGLIALGGGSAIGLAKALSLRSGLPQLVLPTTYAGSEMTPILGETRDGIKTTQRRREIVPDTVIYDVDLTMSLPAATSAMSGLNAMAHAVEALYAPDANPIISLMAEEGIAALCRALPRIVAMPSDRDARADALLGAWLCGTCLGAVSMSLHHKLCHVLGGSFDLPHAETHAIMLPHVVAFNAEGAPEAMRRIARALGTTDAALGLFGLQARLNVPLALADIGMPEDGIDRAAELATRNAYANPRSVDRAGLHELLVRAWRGEARLP